MKQRNARTPSQSSSLEAAIELNRLVLKQHQELLDTLNKSSQAPQDQRPGWWRYCKGPFALSVTWLKTSSASALLGWLYTLGGMTLRDLLDCLNFTQLAQPLGGYESFRAKLAPLFSKYLPKVSSG